MHTISDLDEFLPSLRSITFAPYLICSTIAPVSLANQHCRTQSRHAQHHQQSFLALCVGYQEMYQCQFDNPHCRRESWFSFCLCLPQQTHTLQGTIAIRYRIKTLRTSVLLQQRTTTITAIKSQSKTRRTCVSR
jgi:hypothetical protein